jgi:hypothetical protein
MVGSKAGTGMKFHKLDNEVFQFLFEVRFGRFEKLTGHVKGQVSDIGSIAARVLLLLLLLLLVVTRHVIVETTVAVLGRPRVGSS